ncbi:MAG TPA: DUF4838 domain-containing protein, partial [Abditibacteriaceae bacterium]|nr:DUF4838 domain-containing protein [Abditibacteriaceae bacterium]
RGEAMNFFCRSKTVCLPFLILSLGLWTSASHAQPVRLATNGKAAMPVIVSAGASERVKAAANTLAEYLGRISGAKFEVKTGDEKSGIVVGTAEDFEDAPVGKPFDAKDPTQREDYLMRSHAQGVLLLGATEHAVEHAVWDFLHRLGYRQFFPGKNWEVVPNTPDLKIAVDAREHPDFHTRQIWFSYGTWPDNRERMDKWSAKNRAVRGISLNTGHAYGNIIRTFKAEFDAHPEYFALVAGKRRINPEAKFCISNAGLRGLVVNYVLKYAAEKPDADSVSLDPSDGGYWCECAECAKMGSISDRVTLLANQAAGALHKKYPGKYVAFYAYNFHSPPPSVRVHPNVVVSVATAFIKGGYTVDQLIDGWQKQGATIGIREYYSIIHWDQDMPARARAANPDYLKRTIPHFHAKGGRFMSPESSDNWGPVGLGYYVASRLLWNVKEAERTEAIIEDFLDKSFGTARKPMAEYYRLITGRSQRIFSEDFLGRMYRALDAALELTNDPGARARINDLVLYTRHVELRRNFAEAESKDKQQAYEELIRFSYRIHSSHMAHTIALYRSNRYRGRDGAVKVPAGAEWTKPEPGNPWKSTQPFEPVEIAQMVSNGIANTRLVEFDPVKFSTDLVPASALRLPQVTPGVIRATRGTINLLTWAAKPNTEISLDMRTGTIFQDRGGAQINLFAGAGAIDALPDAAGEDEADEEVAPIVPAEVVARVSLTPAQGQQKIVLKTQQSGLHHLQVSRGAGTTIDWPAGTPMVLHSAPDAAPVLLGRWSLYFYVPKGTPVVGGYATGPGRIRDGNGKLVHEIVKGGGTQYFSIKLEPGQDGMLWKFEHSAGKRVLLTVPPYLVRSADELLLPKEVVDADAPK